MTALVKKRAIVIKPDDSFTIGEIDASLEGLQALVDGYIEAAASTPQGTLFCNEEGKLEGLPVNHLATWLWRHMLLDHRGWLPNDWLVGTVVVLGPVDNFGDETDVTEELIRQFVLASAASSVATIIERG